MISQERCHRLSQGNSTSYVDSTWKSLCWREPFHLLSAHSGTHLLEYWKLSLLTVAAVPPKLDARLTAAQLALSDSKNNCGGTSCNRLYNLPGRRCVPSNFGYMSRTTTTIYIYTTCSWCMVATSRSIPSSTSFRSTNATTSFYAYQCGDCFLRLSGFRIALTCTKLFLMYCVWIWGLSSILACLLSSTSSSR
jgi:hypothetical protein